MEIFHAYTSFFETEISGRYVTYNTVSSLLKKYRTMFEISEIGASVMGSKIEMITIGKGKKKVLAWSQMHGNESTTTKAVFDFLSFLCQRNQFQEQISSFLESHTLYIIPMLNPDGAKLYTRENANEIDLNRDAQQQTQPESKALAHVFKEVQPDVCLNLHDQRTIYGFDSGEVATISFLSPAADSNRTITPARKTAMAYISTMAGVLHEFIPGRVGRYDDAFNENCVGDTFQMAGVPTILFEAGHFSDDYQREETRKYICYALLTLFGFVTISEEKKPRYEALPQNIKNYYDLILRDVQDVASRKLISVGIQYREVLIGNTIQFVPYIEKMGDLSKYFGHTELSLNGAKILVNSQEKYGVGEKVSRIVNKKDNSLLYINEY